VVVYVLLYVEQLEHLVKDRLGVMQFLVKMVVAAVEFSLLEETLKVEVAVMVEPEHPMQLPVLQSFMVVEEVVEIKIHLIKVLVEMVGAALEVFLQVKQEPQEQQIQVVAVAVDLMIVVLLLQEMVVQVVQES